MEFVLESIIHAVDADAMYPALLTALTVPDLAGSVAYPDLRPPERYARWFDGWPLRMLRLPYGIDGYSVYAIRCRLLHEGTMEMRGTPALGRSDATPNLTDVAFRLDREGQAIWVQRRPNRPALDLGTRTPRGGVMIELRDLAQYETTVVWRVDEFCHLIVAATRRWLASLDGDLDARARLERLVREHTHVPGFDGSGRYVR